jgi:hypothetical protein
MGAKRALLFAKSAHRQSVQPTKPNADNFAKWHHEQRIFEEMMNQQPAVDVPVQPRLALKGTACFIKNSRPAR